MKLKDMLSDKQLKTLKSMKTLKESKTPAWQGQFKNRKHGEPLPTLASIQKEYNAKKGKKLNEEYVELMELEEGLEKIAEEWGRWKSGPATEKYDIKPARKEVLNFCMAWLKKYIK
jgi:glycerophosphoryl diester phosphodiesterase